MLYVYVFIPTPKIVNENMQHFRISHVTADYPAGHMTKFASLLTFWRSPMDVGWNVK